MSIFAETSDDSLPGFYLVTTRSYVYRFAKHGDRWHLRAVCALDATTAVYDMVVDWLDAVTVDAVLPMNWPGFPPPHYDPDEPVRYITHIRPDAAAEELTGFRLN